MRHIPKSKLHVWWDVLCQAKKQIGSDPNFKCEISVENPISAEYKEKLPPEVHIRIESRYFDQSVFFSTLEAPSKKPEELLREMVDGLRQLVPVWLEGDVVTCDNFSLPLSGIQGWKCTVKDGSGVEFYPSGYILKGESGLFDQVNNAIIGFRRAVS